MAYVGSTQVTALYLGDELLWPSGYSYHIVANTVAIHYSSGNQINAAGTNYAYFTGDVRLQRGQSIIQTISNAVLTPQSLSSAYFYVSGNEVHAYSRGTVSGAQRSISVSVTYAGSDPVTGGTVYQEANAVVSYSYNLAVSIDVSGTIPYLGGTYDVYYTAQRSPVYTSTSQGAGQNISASVSGTGCTPSPSTVTGVEPLSIDVAQNTSTSLTKTVSVTISADGHSATSPAVTQDAAPVVPMAAVFPEAQSDGSVVLKLVMTQGEYPGGLVAISGIVYHYMLNGGAEQTKDISIKSVGRDGGTDPLPNTVHYFAGDYGEHWFTATRVGQIGIDNTTFPHTQFNIMETLTD